MREPRSNELLTHGHGEYEFGVQKAPKVASLLGQTGEDLRKQILNRMRDENIMKVKDQINNEKQEKLMTLLD